jgi:hypothetical protein
MTQQFSTNSKNTSAQSKIVECHLVFYSNEELLRLNKCEKEKNKYENIISELLIQNSSNDYEKKEKKVKNVTIFEMLENIDDIKLDTMFMSGEELKGLNHQQGGFQLNYEFLNKDFLKCLKHLKDTYGIFPIHPYFLVSYSCKITNISEYIDGCLFVIMNNGLIFSEIILSSCMKTQESSLWRNNYNGYKNVYSFDDKNNVIIMKSFSLCNGDGNNCNSPVRSLSRDIIVNINTIINKPMLSKLTVDYLRNIISNDVSKFNHIITSDFYYMPVIEFDSTIAKNIIQYDRYLLDNFFVNI